MTAQGNIHERADHEAGHIFTADLLELPYVCHWVTMEPGVDAKGRRIGGSCGIGFDKPDPTPEQWKSYLYAGMAAQYLGLEARGVRLDGDLVDQIFAGGIGDRERLQLEVQTLPLEVQNGVNAKILLDETIQLLRPHWERIRGLSEEIQNCKVFYEDEAWVYLRAVDVARDDFSVQIALDRYRDGRIVVAPPEHNDFKQRHPDLEWFESFDQWRARTGYVVRGLPPRRRTQNGAR